MLSYRHAYHAGNHADVLKHLVLSESLRYLVTKPTSIRYVDTHAGPGLVALDEGFAARTAEAADGIGRLWSRDDLPEALGRLLELIKAFNPEGALERYPGSPGIAERLLRDVDRGFLFELHPADAELLGERMLRDPRFRIARRDGLAGLRALLPPPERRAFVLIDPPYERDEEYGLVVDAVEDALRRFSSGVYAVWYPVLSKDQARQLPERILSLGMGRRMRAELRLKASAADGWGMTGSGMVLLNPPWGLKAALEASLPYLAKALGVDGESSWVLEWID